MHFNAKDPSYDSHIDKIQEDLQRAEHQLGVELQQIGSEKEIDTCLLGIQEIIAAKETIVANLNRAYKAQELAYGSIFHRLVELQNVLIEYDWAKSRSNQFDYLMSHYYNDFAKGIDKYYENLLPAEKYIDYAERCYSYELEKDDWVKTKDLSNPGKLLDTLRDKLDALEKSTASHLDPDNSQSSNRRLYHYSRERSLKEVLDVESHMETGNYPSHYSQDNVFRILLASPNYAIYNKFGTYIGQGIKFEIKPSTTGECGEKIYRVRASVLSEENLKISAQSKRLYLYKSATSYSQLCKKEFGHKTLQMLQWDESAISYDENLDLDGYIRVPVTGLVNLGGIIAANQLQETNNYMLAGLGLYGDYVLLLPQEKDEAIDFNTVQDISIAIDYSSYLRGKQ